MFIHSLKFKIWCYAVAGLFLPAAFSFAGNIVYPWRAVPAIVKSGSNFSILFDNLYHAEVDSAVLAGPYNQVTLKIDSVVIGRFEYDPFTKLSVNNTIWASVPGNAPEELYDLFVYCGEEVHLSSKSVKVLQEFNSSHTFIHISDLHVSRQWVGTGENGYAKELELFDRFVEVANIIAPDFVIVTGDIIHHYTLFDADPGGWGENKAYDADQRPLAEEKYRNYYEGAKGFSGIHGINSPVFSLPGNHDSYGVSRKDHLAMASQWNRLCGKRVFGFSYAGTRVIASDDFLGDPVTDIPDLSPMSGLQGEILKSFLRENGPGELCIMAQHRPDRIDTAFIDKHKINILLNGHRHNPFEEKVGSTPTLSIRPGTVCRSGEISRWQETLGFFRIFYIQDARFEYTPPLRFCKNPIAPYTELQLNLSLHYRNANDGTFDRNEAVIQNSFDIGLPRCKIRFVMKKGNYHVSGGSIHQVIQSGDRSVVDVYTDVGASSNKKVKIYSSK
ncbi:MAG: metallophosphoesterase family protein [Mangrovibacterium sp.]